MPASLVHPLLENNAATIVFLSNYMLLAQDNTPI